ncbi:MAG TPA: phospholipase D-like domain-containing protein [Blastocatellia bacterium]|nr:phospholipase D-like domain-containing protein [Blastocatellia bacterium]
MDLSAFNVIAIIAIAFLSLMLFLALFEPALPYRITRDTTVPLDSKDFLRIIEALADSQVHPRTRVEVLTNGEVYYEAELEAISKARHNINIEAYIFQKGVVARRFVEALAERAAAGVQVNIVLDAIGSFATWNSYFKELTDAGGRVFWYHPFKWYTLPRINNRTHRELFIIDGEVGFMGGAGVADHWLVSKPDRPRWRDTMFKVEGVAVAGLQAAFAENWLEASGEILIGKEYFPFCETSGTASALIVDSSPTAGMSTRARMLYQTLIASAQESIYITTPYFLPDRSARREMVRAIRERGVEIKIITPGKQNDHLLTRRSSRRLYGELLRAGAEIYEYEPAMIHTKSMIVDRVWSVVGSTNFDNRSFGLNDEVNLAAFDRNLAERLEQDFRRDVAASHAVSYDEWRQRSIFERAHEWLGWVLERQQ